MPSSPFTEHQAKWKDANGLRRVGMGFIIAVLLHVTVQPTRPREGGEEQRSRTRWTAHKAASRLRTGRLAPGINILSTFALKVEAEAFSAASAAGMKTILSNLSRPISDHWPSRKCWHHCMDAAIAKSVGGTLQRDFNHINGQLRILEKKKRLWGLTNGGYIEKNCPCLHYL